MHRFIQFLQPRPQKQNLRAMLYAFTEIKTGRIFITVQTPTPEWVNGTYGGIA
jgi:hypothetical protein